MLERLDVALGRWLEAVVRFVTARAVWVVTTIGLATVAAGIWALGNVGLNMDHKRLLSPDLPFQRAAARFVRHFPNLDDALLVVVDGETPELAREGVRRLAARLKERGDVFHDVYVPGVDDFFLRNGLLYRSVDELEDFVDDLARFQPVIAELVLEASLARVTGLIQAGLEENGRREGADEDLPALLDQVGHATVQVFADYPVAVSWEDLMLDGTAVDPGRRWVVIAEPKLDFDALLPAADAIAAIDAAVTALGLIPERGVEVRITGNPALNHDEILGLVWDVGAAGVASAVVILTILGIALRSRGVVAACGLTLVVGLIWTLAFAAAAVGKLNVLSVAFGVLFIGLGVDFAIHLGMYTTAMVAGGAGAPEALAAATRRIGTALVLCAATTAIGFLSFVPTPYLGVAQLGLIAGAGMVVILVLTLTLFPSLIVLLYRPADVATAAATPGLLEGATRWVSRQSVVIVVVFLVLGVLAGFRLDGLRFDSNVVTMRNQSTRSVQALRDLLADRQRSPWSIDVLSTSLDEANATAARIRRLPSVDSVATLQDYVPDEQEDKREILFDAALMLDIPRAARVTGDPPSVEEQIAALRAVRDLTMRHGISDRHTPLGRSMRRLRLQLDRFLRRLEELPDPDEALAELEEVLFGGFGEQIARLQGALEPDEVELDTLPVELRRRLLAPDGHARVQVFPREDLSDTEALERFVDDVRQIEPDATGVAVNFLEFGRATVVSLQRALVLALVAVLVLLGILLHRVTDAVLVLAPLIVAGLLTAGTMIVLDIPLNFVNVVVLPLLLGIGVDSGIHLVRSWSRGDGAGSGVLATTAARAVFFSALTTTASFGSLALSPHRGIASLGVVLVIGMSITLASNLVFLPALLALRDRG